MKSKVSLKVKIVLAYFSITSIFAIVLLPYYFYTAYKYAVDYSVRTLDHQSEAYVSVVKNYNATLDAQTQRISSFFQNMTIENLEKNKKQFLESIKNTRYLSNAFVSLQPHVFVNIVWLNKMYSKSFSLFSAVIPEKTEIIVTIIKTNEKSIIEQKTEFFDEKGLYLGTTRDLNHDQLEECVKSFDNIALESLKKTVPHKTIFTPIFNELSITKTKKLAHHSSYILFGATSKIVFGDLDLNRVTENSSLFVLDDQNMIMAATGRNYLKLMDMNDESMALLKTAYQHYSQANEEALKSGTVYFSHQGNSYIVAIKTVPKTTKLDWKIVSIIPLGDLVADVTPMQLSGALIAGIISMITLLWFYFYTNRYAQPIEYLGEEAKKIREFDLEDTVNIEGNSREIENLTYEVQNMKTSVKNFSRFIPKGVLEKLVNSGQEIEVGGKLMDVTLFFSDIRGFTTISEGMNPGELLNHLSDYFEELTGVIAQNHGTIDKYIGDSIMAFWGAPEADEIQAERACRTALICQQKIHVLNKYWKADNKPELFTRIGIHSGDAIIGNMGSSERLNYTAIGDNVNLASRLEGANKIYGTEILISQKVVDKLPSYFMTRPVDIVAVKGKDLGIKIFELVGIEGDPQLSEVSAARKKIITSFTTGFELYLAQKFEKALSIFEKMAQEDPLCVQYIERCKDFIKSPPPKNWDGVVYLHQK